MVPGYIYFYFHGNIASTKKRNVKTSREETTEDFNMKLLSRKNIAAIGALMLLAGFSVGAAELEGRNLSMDLQTKSIYVNGAQIFITDQTRLENMF